MQLIRRYWYRSLDGRRRRVGAGGLSLELTTSNEQQDSFLVKHGIITGSRDHTVT